MTVAEAIEIAKKENIFNASNALLYFLALQVLARYFDNRVIIN